MLALLATGRTALHAYLKPQGDPIPFLSRSHILQGSCLLIFFFLGGNSPQVRGTRHLVIREGWYFGLGFEARGSGCKSLGFSRVYRGFVIVLREIKGRDSQVKGQTANSDPQAHSDAVFWGSFLLLLLLLRLL